MHRLEVPHPLAGLDVERDQALGEQVVARPVAAVVVAGRRARRQVHVAQLLVGAHRRPDVGVARVAPRLVAPGVGAEVVPPRHRAEDPPHVPGAGVHPLDPAGRRLLRDCPVGDDVRRDHHAAGHDGRRGHPHQVAAAVVRASADGARDALHQVDAAVVAEAEHRCAGFRVERDQIPLVGPEEDAGIVLVAPPGDPARVVEVGRLPAQIDLRVVHPDRLAGLGVYRRHLVQRGRDVEDPRHHQRRRLEHPDPEARELFAQRVEIERPVGRLPAPGDSKIGEVAGVDLVEGRVLGAAGVAAVAPPFTAGRAVLGARLGRTERGRAPCQEHHGDENRGAAPRALHRHLRLHYTRAEREASRP